MTAPPTKQEALEQIAKTADVEEQLKLRTAFRDDENYYSHILNAYLWNPFLRLTEEEANLIARKGRPVALAQIVAARDAATRSDTPKYVVFCMPKSGSSFLQSALQRALQLPFVSLTGFGGKRLSSHLGMNSREQELDELAVIKAVVTSPQGFVAQHHTRYSAYLGLQMQLFGLSPIVTCRNVLDCIVSFDDMILKGRGRDSGPAWQFDAQFALPSDYTSLPDEARYAVLAPSYGAWLINFYLSWKRGQAAGPATPLMIRYEDHILDRDQLVELLAAHIAMTDEQKDRLAAYVNEPDRQRSRLNVGRAGRGRATVPEHLVRFLADYAGLFRADLTPAEIEYLVA